MRALRPAACAAAALALTASLTGCGARVAGDGDGGTARNTAVTLENCGKKLTFDKTPERVVTNDVGITEIMFALGLEDRMAGYVMPDDKGDLDHVPWKDAYKKTTWLSKQAITKETAVDARADLVFAGWGYGFGENGITPASLKKLGIDAYVLTESCRNGQGSARGVMPPLDALYTDLTRLGKLFGVEDRARKLIADFKGRVADVRKKAPRGDARPSVFLYDSGQDKPFTAGRYAAPDDIIAKAGGRSIPHDLADSWTTVGWETVVERDPEVIVINDYGDTSAEQKKQFLLHYKPLANVSAIKHRRIITLDYADLVESPRNPSAIERLGSYLGNVAR